MKIQENSCTHKFFPSSGGAEKWLCVRKYLPCLNAIRKQLHTQNLSHFCVIQETAAHIKSHLLLEGCRKTASCTKSLPVLGGTRKLCTQHHSQFLGGAGKELHTQNPSSGYFRQKALQTKHQPVLDDGVKQLHTQIGTLILTFLGVAGKPRHTHTHICTCTHTHTSQLWLVQGNSCTHKISPSSG